MQACQFAGPGRNGMPQGDEIATDYEDESECGEHRTVRKSGGGSRQRRAGGDEQLSGDGN